MDQLSMAFSDYIASAVEQLKPHLRPTAGERSSLKTTSLVMEGEPLINQGFCRSEQERVPLFNSWALQDQPITGEPGCGSCTHYSLADLPRPGHTLGSCFPLFHSWSPIPLPDTAGLESHRLFLLGKLESLLPWLGSLECPVTGVQCGKLCCLLCA